MQALKSLYDNGIRNIKSVGRLTLVGGAALAVNSSVFAAGPDFTALTSAVDFGTVVTAVLAVAALLAVVYVAMKGASMVLGFIRR